MKSERRNGWSFVMVFIVVTFMMGSYTFFKLSSESDPAYINVTIVQGDTLWELFHQYQSRTEFSTKDFVEWIEEKNGVRSNRLQPGDIVMIPVERNHMQFASD